MERRWREEDAGKDGRLTQIMVGSLQSCAAFSQNVHLKHRLGFHLHGEGGDGTLIEAFGHVVIQTFSQLPNVSTQVLQALSVLRLQERDSELTSEEPAEGRHRGRKNSSNPSSVQSLRKQTSSPTVCVCVCKP